MKQRCIACLLLLFGFNAAKAADIHPLWGPLKPGRYAVGFYQSIVGDATRKYDYVFKGGAHYADTTTARPLLINVWYPTDHQQDPTYMPYDRYFFGPLLRQVSPVREWMKDLMDYSRDGYALEAFGKADGLTDAQQAAFKRFLKTPTAALWNAEPAKGKFPLVVYHQGFGSTFDDNSVFCEWLASHGYVVMGASFQRGSGSTFNIDGRAESDKDIAFLIGQARNLRFVDSHVGLLGHSGGAQASLLYRAGDGPSVDATVSLDTTEDYYNIDDPRWLDITVPIESHREKMTGPILMEADAFASFQLADTWTGSSREYFTGKEDDHDDYISLGHVTRILKSWAAPDPKADEDARRLYERYAARARYILAYFDDHLKGHPEDHVSLESGYSRTKLGREGFHVETAGVGDNGPSDYSPSQSDPPTPRQFLRVLRRQGVDVAIGAINRFRRFKADAPIYSPNFAFTAISGLLDDGKTETAVSLYQGYEPFTQGIPRIFIAMAQLSASRPKLAKKFLRQALILDPENQDAKARLEKLGG